MNRRKRQRGSVLVIVLGLLTVVAMLGSMLLLLARTDKQASQAMATTASERPVAEAILARLVADRLDDLHIAGDVPYGNITGTFDEMERQIIDYPHEDYDPALACIETYKNGGVSTWRHVSHLPGTELAISASNVPVDDPNLVDTDGDGTGDALPFSTGIMDPAGGTYWAAVRMIDACGLINVNTADVAGMRTVDPNKVIGPNYVALEEILPINADDIVAKRLFGNEPFDMGDMLAAAWYGPSPNTANGRLATAAGGEFATARKLITTVSFADPSSAPLWTGDIPRNRPYKIAAKNINPDDPNIPLWYDAFLGVLAAGGYDPDDDVNKLAAAQLAVNLADYLDEDNEPTEFDAGSLPDSDLSNVYGVERHPFVSKVYRKRINYDPGVLADQNIVAIELINPYAVDIPLDNYSLDGFPATWAGKVIRANGGRFVIYSSDDANPPVEIDTDIDDDSKLAIDDPTLTLETPVKILWSPDGGGYEVCVDVAPFVDAPAPDETHPERWLALYRNDDLSKAWYSVEIYQPSPEDDPAHDYADDDPGTDPKMGRANPTDTLPAPGTPQPVYVRNGPLVSLGDLMRILTVGPTDEDPLSRKLLAPPPMGNHLLPYIAAVSTNAWPKVPVGCLLGEFFNLVDDPIADPNTGNVAGMININTAPTSILKTLPGVYDAGKLQAGLTDDLAEEIAAYRELRRSASGRDYDDRVAATGITDLRDRLGFVGAGEVAIPLRMRLTDVMPGGVNRFSNNPPDNYLLSDDGTSEDGLPNGAVTGDPVKEHMLYTWLANAVTVRSNTFIAYIRIQRDNDPASPGRYYVAVIDRSNCRSSIDRPKVLLFTELR